MKLMVTKLCKSGPTGRFAPDFGDIRKLMSHNDPKKHLSLQGQNYEKYYKTSHDPSVLSKLWAY